MRWIAGTRPQLSSLNYQLGQKPTENTEDTEILNKGLRAYYLISDLQPQCEARPTGRSVRRTRPQRWRVRFFQCGPAAAGDPATAGLPSLNYQQRPCSRHRPQISSRVKILSTPGRRNLGEGDTEALFVSEQPRLA
jgi:hypothetical protein